MSPADSTSLKHAPLADFLDGMRQCMPVVIASSPFSMLFGTVAVQNGLTVGEATLMSVAMFAGASQLVGMELFGQKVAPWLIVLSIFAVNFRHVLYSAAMGRRMRNWSWTRRIVAFFLLTDAQYAFGEKQALTGRLTFAWYMGYGIFLYSCWVIGTVVGAMFGNLIPDPHALGLDFMLPIYFLGMVMGFRKRPLWLPVVATSAIVSIVAYYLIGSPWNVSVGALAGIVVAAVFTPANGESAA